MLSKPAWLRDISYKLEAPNSDAVGLARELQAAARAIQRAYMLSKINPTEDDDAGAGEARHRPIPHEETRVGDSLQQRLADVEVARDNWHDQHDDVAQQLADIRDLWERASRAGVCILAYPTGWTFTHCDWDSGIATVKRVGGVSGLASADFALALAALPEAVAAAEKLHKENK